MLEGFREYLLAVAHGELDEDLRGKLGPSDLVQETFVQAQRGFSGFSGTSEPELRAWLCQILRNRFRDLRGALLAAKCDARLEEAIGGASSAWGRIESLQVDTQTPSRHAVADEEAARVMAALGSLSDEARKVIWLRNWEGLSFNEIGIRLGRTAEAVRSSFSRAVSELGRVLKETDGESAFDRR